MKSSLTILSTPRLEDQTPTKEHPTMFETALSQ